MKVDLKIPFPKTKMTYSAADTIKLQEIATGIETFLGMAAKGKFMHFFEEFAWGVATVALNYEGGKDGDFLAIGRDLPLDYSLDRPALVLVPAGEMHDLVVQCGHYAGHLKAELDSLLTSAEKDAWQQGRAARYFTA